MRIRQVMSYIRQFSGKIRSDIYASVLDQLNPQNATFLRQLEKELSMEYQLDLPLNRLKTVVFDLETSGFYPEYGDKILSIGAVKMTGEMVHEEETFYSLVKSNVKIPPEIVELTGIDEKQINTAPYFDEVIIRFFQFIKDHTLVAHHARHEERFMSDAMIRLTRGHFPNRIFDTSFLLQVVEPELDGATLDHCCSYFGIDIEHRHHALGDAVATAKLWSRFMEESRKAGFCTLRDLYTLLKSRRFV